MGALRIRLRECRQSNATLATWRELQLAVLDAARQIQRRKLEAAKVASDASSSAAHPAVWTLLGDAFWLERDLALLERMVEEVIANLEAQCALPEVEGERTEM